MTIVQQSRIIADYNRTHTAKELSAEIGLSAYSIRLKACRLRKQNYDIPKRLAIGTIRAVMGGFERRIKTANGWKYYPKEVRL